MLLYSSVAGAVERTWISGPIVCTGFGLLIGPVGLDLLSWETDRETIRSLAEVTLAMACSGLAQLPGGSGFIASFSGGLLFGILAKDLREEFLLAAEGTGDTLALVTWLMFGSAVVGQALGYFTWLILFYAMLSLTIIRMLPVFVSLAGSGIDTEGKLSIGWFGPRGLASIVFAVIVANSGLPNTGPIAMTVVCTIVLSIILHGITANPWARAYGKRQQLAQQASGTG